MNETVAPVITARFAYPNNGRTHEREEAGRLLCVGEDYFVEHFVVSPYSTDVYLKDFKNRFNSVFFKFFKDGNPYDPTKDKANFSWQTKGWINDHE